MDKYLYCQHVDGWYNYYMNKQMTVDTIEKALALTYKYLIGCNGNLIFGAEAEDFETGSSFFIRADLPGKHLL